MEILNESPFQPGSVAGRVYFPGHSVTLIVKGTFRLVPDGVAEIAEDQAPPTGDEPFEDAEGEEEATLRYAADFAHYKPRADLMLVGHARAPGGRPVPRLRVSFGVGDHVRSLHVTGDRWWTTEGMSTVATEPRPFAAMPLRYERAFGGAGYAPNPAGRGVGQVESEQGYPVWPLPNVEDPAGAAGQGREPAAPAGFAPLRRDWHPRAAMTGTYGREWLERRWPWYPEDFRWEYFNAAPAAMQKEGFLRGDEEVLLENLDQEEPEFRGRLPGLRVRCFLHEDEPGAGEPPRASGDGAPQDGARGASGAGRTRFREIPMNLDTLWVDADSRTLVLVWRGLADAQSEELDEIRHLYIRSEPLADPAPDVEACRREFLAALEEEEELEPAEVVPPDPFADVDAEVAAGKAAMNEDLVAAGMDPVDDPPDPDAFPEASPETREESRKLLEEQGIDPGDLEPEEDAPVIDRAYVEGRAEAGEDLGEIDFTGVDLEDAHLAGASLDDADLWEGRLARATLDGASLKGADLSGSDLTGASLREADLTEADLTGARLTGADLSGATLADAVFEEAKLERAVLDGAQAPNVGFAGADLTGATARASALAGCDLDLACLDGADFARADLSEASLEGAAGERARFAGAVLTGANLTEASFPHADFRQADGEGSNWQGCRLPGADLAFAALPGSDFTEADLAGATFSAAELTGATFDRAGLTDAAMVQCNLFRASLEKADLARADLSGSNLYGAGLREARLSAARFYDANIRKTLLDPEIERQP